jgi:hypothetical protein
LKKLLIKNLAKKKKEQKKRMGLKFNKKKPKKDEI